MSQVNGVNPAWIIEAQSLTHVRGGTHIEHSPNRSLRAISVNSFAEDPELTIIANFTPSQSAKARSASSILAPLLRRGILFSSSHSFSTRMSSFWMGSDIRG